MGCESSTSMAAGTTQPMKKGKLIVTYFGFHGRAEALRMLFHHLKMDFENIEVGQPEWKAK
jgi:predicted aldo/keto reductase-like oxidoreductase